MPINAERGPIENILFQYIFYSVRQNLPFFGAPESITRCLLQRDPIRRNPAQPACRDNHPQPSPRWSSRSSGSQKHPPLGLCRSVKNAKTAAPLIYTFNWTAGGVYMRSRFNRTIHRVDYVVFRSLKKSPNGYLLWFVSEKRFWSHTTPPQTNNVIIIRVSYRTGLYCVVRMTTCEGKENYRYPRDLGYFWGFFQLRISCGTDSRPYLTWAWQGCSYNKHSGTLIYVSI